jgi:hypothetical protein
MELLRRGRGELGWFYSTGGWLAKEISMNGRILAAYATINGRCCSGAVPSPGSEQALSAARRDCGSETPRLQPQVNALGLLTGVTQDPGGLAATTRL